MADRVTVTMTGGVADVRLSRADKMNALDPAMFDALIATCGRLGKERGLRAVVLSGEGRAFCAGLDLNSFAAMKEGGFRNLEARTHGISNAFQYAVMGWRELGVPVIAAVHGIAYGGGFQLALGADVRSDRRGHAHVHHGDKMGHRPRHGRHGPDAAFGARRRDP